MIKLSFRETSRFVRQQCNRLFCKSFTPPRKIILALRLQHTTRMRLIEQPKIRTERGLQTFHSIVKRNGSPGQTSKGGKMKSSICCMLIALLMPVLAEAAPLTKDELQLLKGVSHIQVNMKGYYNTSQPCDKDVQLTHLGLQDCGLDGIQDSYKPFGPDPVLDAMIHFIRETLAKLANNPTRIWFAGIEHPYGTESDNCSGWGDPPFNGYWINFDGTIANMTMMCSYTEAGDSDGDCKINYLLLHTNPSIGIVMDSGAIPNYWINIPKNYPTAALKLQNILMDKIGGPLENLCPNGKESFSVIK